MKRILRIALTVVAAFLFTVFAGWAEPRHPSFSHNVTFPGIWITFAIYALLHLDLLGPSPLPGFLSIAFNTLIYSGLIGLLLKVCRRHSVRHDQQR